LALGGVFAPMAVAAPYGPDANTPAEAAVAGVLDAGGGSLDIRSSLDALPSSSARADALGQLSVRNYRLLPRLAIQSMDATDRALRGSLVQRREQILDAPAGVPLKGDRTLHLTVTYGLKQGKYDGQVDRPRANSDSRSIMAALDVSPAPGLIIGGTLGIDGIDMNLDRSQRPRSTVFTATYGGYASYTNGQFYVDATAAYANTEYKVRRQVTYAGFSDRLFSAPRGDNASASLEAGAIISRGAVRLQPFAGLQYRYADLGGALEQGGDAALAVAKFKTEAVRSNLGARVTASTRSGDWTLRPSLEGLWQRELKAHPDSRIEAIFADGSTPIFTFPRSRVFHRDAGIVTAALSAVHKERTSLRLSYTGEYSSDRKIHAFGVTLSRRLP